MWVMTSDWILWEDQQVIYTQEINCLWLNEQAVRPREKGLKDLSWLSAATQTQNSWKELMFWELLIWAYGWSPVCPWLISWRHHDEKDIVVESPHVQCVVESPHAELRLKSLKERDMTSECTSWDVTKSFVCAVGCKSYWWRSVRVQYPECQLTSRIMMESCARGSEKIDQPKDFLRNGSISKRTSG